MNDRQEDTSDSVEAMTGRAARRNFIKNSGRIAAVAPAVVLLLSAGRANAVANTTNYGPAGPSGNPVRAPHNLLDP